MKKNWIAIVATITVVSILLAGIFARISGEEKMLNYWQTFAEALVRQDKIDSTNIKERISSTLVNEIIIKSETLSLKIEKSNDQDAHFSYYVNTNEKLEPLIVTEGAIVNFHADKLFPPKNNLKVNLNLQNTKQFGVKFQDSKEATAVVRVPSHIKKIKIEIVSGAIEMSDVTLDEIQIDSVSGDFKLEKSNIKVIKYSSVSGDINLQGLIENSKLKTVSGDLKFISDLSSPEINFSTISGDANLIFTEEPNANVMFESTSGDIKFWGGLPVNKIEGVSQGFKLGNGTSQLMFETTSGDVEISHEIN